MALLLCHGASLKAAPPNSLPWQGSPESLLPPSGLSSLGSSENPPRGGVFHGTIVHTRGPFVTPILASALGFRPVGLPHPLHVSPACGLCAKSRTAQSEPRCRPLCLRGWRRWLPGWHHCRILAIQSASTQGGHGTPTEGRAEALPACRSGQGRSNC